MEKVNDFLKEIRFRITTPLLSSFIISWLIVNWHIVFGVLFYGNQDLIVDGYKSKIDLVNQNSSTGKMLWHPLIGVSIYILIIPFLRNGIQILNGWFSSWGTKATLNVMREGAIPMAKYISVKEGFEQRTKELIKAFTEDQRLIQSNNKLAEKIQMLDVDRVRSIDMLNSIKQKSNPSFFEGNWKLRFIDSQGEEVEHRVYISGYLISKFLRPGNTEPLFAIQNIAFNPNTEEFILLLRDQTNGPNKEFTDILRPVISNDNNKFQTHNPLARIISLIRE
jgi:hypothetical protein